MLPSLHLQMRMEKEDVPFQHIFLWSLSIKKFQLLKPVRLQRSREQVERDKMVEKEFAYLMQENHTVAQAIGVSSLLLVRRIFCMTKQKVI